MNPFWNKILLAAEGLFFWMYKDFGVGDTFLNKTKANVDKLKIFKTKKCLKS